jgi:hypothetical protein
MLRARLAVGWITNQHRAETLARAFRSFVVIAGFTSSPTSFARALRAVSSQATPTTETAAKRLVRYSRSITALLVLDLEYLDSFATFGNTSISQGARSVPNSWRLSNSPDGNEIATFVHQRNLRKRKPPPKDN